MLTKEELKFLYELLDQMPSRGEEAKAFVLEMMRKLRLMQEEKEQNEKFGSNMDIRIASPCGGGD